MSDAFLLPVVETLLPGGVLPNGIVAPRASAVSAEWHSLHSGHAAMLALIGQTAGGARAFAEAEEEERTRILADVERAHPVPFSQLVIAALVLYYEHPDVLTAFGWSSDPPQPHGHTLPPFDETLLAPVTARGRLRRE